MKVYKQIILGSVLLVLGLFIGHDVLMQSLYKLQHADNKAAAFTSDAQPAHKPSVRIDGNPVRLNIPELNIDLAIIDGYFNARSGAWTLSLDKVQYATITPVPNNESGNTFIYGHNRRGVFYNLYKIKGGTEAIVTTSNNHQFIYTFSRSYETSPTDTSLFTYAGAPILTLQTCSGLWYQNRQLFSFSLKEVR